MFMPNVVMVTQTHLSQCLWKSRVNCEMKGAVYMTYIVWAGCRGNCGVWHGHRQAWCSLRHPPLAEQVHGESVPGEWQSRSVISTTTASLPAALKPCWRGHYQQLISTLYYWDSLLVRMLDSGWKGCEFESQQEQRENFLLQSRLCVLTLLLGVRSTPVLPQWHVKLRPRSFCQKCRWQVTPKHEYTFDPTKSEWGDYAAFRA